MTTSPSTDLLDSLLTHARRSGAEAADAIMYDSTEISLARRMRAPETLERAESSALGLRVFTGSKQAVVSSTDMNWETLKELAEQAVAMALASTDDPDAGLAPAHLLARDIPELDLYDPAEPDESWMMRQAEEAEEAALSTPGITNSEGADAHYSAYRITLVTAPAEGEGFHGSYRSTSFSLSASVLAGSGTQMERDYDYAHTRHRADLPEAASIGKSAAARALARLHPRKVKTCQVPVVFDPRVSKSLVGYFASAISGNAVARGTSFLQHKRGEQIFAPHITIVDDPHIRRGLGSKPFDGEGVRNKRTALIEEGVLTTWLLDVRSANKLKLAPTGHAARGTSSPPSPSATNLYMAAGNLTAAELMKDIQSGLYVMEVFGMGVNLVTGDYSQCASGFWIENGIPTYPVSEITIAGNLSDMFLRATPANDLTFRYATNCPTLRVDGMTIAGT